MSEICELLCINRDILESLRQIERHLTGSAGVYQSAKTIPWVGEYFDTKKKRGIWSILGKKLVLQSKIMGYQVKQVVDPDYGHVNQYHIDVIRAYRDHLDRYPDELSKYRILQIDKKSNDKNAIAKKSKRGDNDNKPSRCNRSI